MLDPSQFTFISESDINALALYLDSIGLPVKLCILRREFIRLRLKESEIKYWAPEKTFTVGEDIVVLTHDRDYSVIQIKGRIVSIERNCRGDLSLLDTKVSYDKICVRCLNENHFYPTNCPELRSFMENSVCADEESVNELPFITIDSYSYLLAKTIDPVLIQALSEDSRFVNFSDEWCLQSLLSSFIITQDSIEKARKAILCKRRPLMMREILSEANLEETDRNELVRFLLCKNLADEKLFCFFIDNNDTYWSLASPQSRAVNKVESYTIEKGIIRVTIGVRKLLANIGIYEPNARVPIRIRGNFLINGVFDGDSHIQSGQIAEWMSETSLVPGDHIYLAIDEDNSNIRLYSQYDVEKRNVVIDGNEPIDIESHLPSLALRDKIFIVLKKANSFLHYKQIHSEVIQKFHGNDKPQSIAATLSINRQMFCQGYRMLWGLVEWQGKEYLPDRTAIIFATREDDLVYKLLAQREQPMNYDDLCQSIAEYFGLSKSFIHTSDVLNTNDTRVIRLLDGKFALSEWIELWKQRKSNLEMQKYNLEENKSKVWTLRKNIEDFKANIAKLNSLISNLEGEIESINNDHQLIVKQKNSITKQLEATLIRIKFSFWIGNLFAVISLCIIIVAQSFSFIPGMFLLFGLFSYIFLWYSKRVRNSLQSKTDVFEKEVQLKLKWIDDLKSKIFYNQKDLQSKNDTLVNYKTELNLVENEIRSLNLEEIIKEIRDLEELIQLAS